MEKVAIVTIESFNYGNRLQNYALQEVLKSMGYVVRTVHCLLYTSRTAVDAGSQLRMVVSLEHGSKEIV